MIGALAVAVGRVPLLQLRRCRWACAQARARRHRQQRRVLLTAKRKPTRPRGNSLDEPLVAQRYLHGRPRPHMLAERFQRLRNGDLVLRRPQHHHE